MANRLKYYIAEKISSNVRNNVLPNKIAKSMKALSVDYNLGIQIGSVNPEFTANIFKNVEPVIDVTETGAEEKGTVVVKFKKDFFVKNIVEEIVENRTTIQSQPKSIVIDYSSPNIAKPFHVGHLRSTIIGNFIAKINKYYSNNVVKLNYLGDWGTQFGLLKIGMMKRGINAHDLKDDPIKKLFDCYVAANKLAKEDKNISEEARKYFTAIEKGKQNLDEWKMIREFTVNELQRIYQRLNVQFDVYNWESDYNAPAIYSTITFLKESKLLDKDSDGKWIVDVDGRPVTVLKSDDSSLYLTRDIAAVLDRHEKYTFDKMLYVVDNAQTDHFKALFHILRKLNKPFSESCEHIKFGRIQGMSTRNGQVVFLNDILNEAKSRVHQMQLSSPNTRASAMNEEVCDILGATAVIINDLKRNRLKDYKFEWERALQTEGDSGIRLQYIHCRLWSLEQRSGRQIPSECDPKALMEPEAIDLVLQMAKFEDILQRACLENEASILANYLFRFAHKVNRALQVLNVKNAEKDLGEQRLLLFHASRLIIRKGLLILGVTPLNEM